MIGQLIDRFKGSLLLRLTIFCLAGLIAVWLVNVSLWFAKFQRDIEDTYMTNGREMTEVMAEAVELAVWNFDDENAREILEGFALISGLIYAEVFIYDGDSARFSREDPPAELRDLGRALVESGEDAIVGDDRMLFRQVVTHSSGETIGVVVTAFSLVPMHTLVATARRETVVTQFFSFGILAVLIGLVLRAVIRPLVDVTGIIDDVASGDIHRNVPYLHRRDEVGRLAAAVSHFQQNADALIAIEAEAEANRIFAIQAEIDALTQLPNRRAMTNLFEALEQDGIDPDTTVALLHMDLDGFKQINDTLGHNAGDHVLCVVAERLNVFADRCRLIARIGGDEFVVVLTKLSRVDTGARDLADDFIRSVRAPMDFEGQRIRVGCSIGIAYHDEDERDLLATLVHADIALYKAKDNGKNQWVEFDEEQRHAVIARKRLSDELHAALEEHQFIPYFQPIVDANSGKIVALEVLSRWSHPTRGIVEPGAYIDLAKDLKLIRFIDREILRQAIDVMRDLAARIPELPRLSVNVSAERLIEPDLLENVRALADTPIKLDIELLESSYLDDVSDQIIWRLDQLRELGVGIHIDDFGTGHASLAGLLRVAPDVMKIDRYFISGATQSDKERAIMESLVNIADRMGIKVVCEGIETAEQAELARSLGCGHAARIPVAPSDGPAGPGAPVAQTEGRVGRHVTFTARAFGSRSG